MIKEIHKHQYNSQGLCSFLSNIYGKKKELHEGCLLPQDFKYPQQGIIEEIAVIEQETQPDREQVIRELKELSLLSAEKQFEELSSQYDLKMYESQKLEQDLLTLKNQDLLQFKKEVSDLLQGPKVSKMVLQDEISDQEILIILKNRLEEIEQLSAQLEIISKKENEVQEMIQLLPGLTIIQENLPAQHILLDIIKSLQQNSFEYKSNGGYEAMLSKLKNLIEESNCKYEEDCQANLKKVIALEKTNQQLREDLQRDSLNYKKQIDELKQEFELEKQHSVENQEEEDSGLKERLLFSKLLLSSQQEVESILFSQEVNTSLLNGHSADSPLKQNKDDDQGQDFLNQSTALRDTMDNSAYLNEKTQDSQILAKELLASIQTFDNLFKNDLY